MQCITARLHTHTHTHSHLPSFIAVVLFLSSSSFAHQLRCHHSMFEQDSTESVAHEQTHNLSFSNWTFLSFNFCKYSFFFPPNLQGVFFFLPQRKNCRSSLVCKITETSGTGHERILSGLVLCEFWAQACPGTCIHLEWVHSGPESFMLFVYEHVLHIS